MKLTYFYISTLLVLLFSSCQNNEEMVAPQPPVTSEPTDAAKAFLKNAQSDAPSNFYVSGEFDGYKIYCASKPEDTNYSYLLSFNVFYGQNSLDVEKFQILRQNSSRTILAGLYFNNTNLFSCQYPYVLPHSNLAYCENAQVEFINLRKIGTTGQGAPDDDFSFFGHTDHGLKVQVTSFVNNIVEGTFEGPITTKTGSQITVKNGKFRIQVITIIKENLTPST